MFYVLFFFVCEFLVFRIYISIFLERKKKFWGFVIENVNGGKFLC